VSKLLKADTNKRAGFPCGEFAINIPKRMASYVHYKFFVRAADNLYVSQIQLRDQNCDNPPLIRFIDFRLGGFAQKSWP